MSCQLQLPNRYQLTGDFFDSSIKNRVEMAYNFTYLVILAIILLIVIVMIIIATIINYYYVSTVLLYMMKCFDCLFLLVPGLSCGQWSGANDQSQHHREVQHQTPGPQKRCCPGLKPHVFISHLFSELC